MTELFSINASMPNWAKRLAVFDLETTGLDLREARIVTACALEIDESGSAVGENYEWLANPGIDIPEAASNVHGITTEIAKQRGRPAPEVVFEIVEKLRGYFELGIPVVAYNAPYDFSILHFEARRHGIPPLENPRPIIDPLVLDKYVDQYRPGKRTLEVSAAVYGVRLDLAHNATADAIAAGRVAQAIASKFAEQLDLDAEELHSRQIGWSEQQDNSYESFRRKTAPDFSIKRGWPLKL